MEDIRNAVQFAADRLGVEALKDKHKEATYHFVGGRDCFVILPTEYGITLCYVLLLCLRLSAQASTWMVWFVFRP